jgi:hypothetical protein
MAIANVDAIWPRSTAGTSKVEADPVRQGASAAAASFSVVEPPSETTGYFRHRADEYRRIPKMPAEDYTGDEELF